MWYLHDHWKSLGNKSRLNSQEWLPRYHFRTGLPRASLVGIEHGDLIITPTKMFQQPDLPAEIAKGAGVWTQVLREIRQVYQLCKPGVREIGKCSFQLLDIHISAPYKLIWGYEGNVHHPLYTSRNVTRYSQHTDDSLSSLSLLLLFYLVGMCFISFSI